MIEDTDSGEWDAGEGDAGELLGLGALEDALPADYFDELVQRVDRRELGFDILGIMAFGFLEATTFFTEMLMALGVIEKREPDSDD